MHTSCTHTSHTQHARAQQDAGLASWWGPCTHSPEMQAVLALANFDTSEEMGPADQVRRRCSLFWNSKKNRNTDGGLDACADCIGIQKKNWTYDGGLDASA